MRDANSVTGAARGYDYVIVGSGSAGSVVAARLSENPAVRVLVLEAGGRDRSLWLRLPVGYFRSIYNPAYSHLYRAAPDPGIAGRRMDCPRGRVLGGSGAINGLIYARGQHEDFDDWAALGATGWGFRDVLPHFRSIETYDGAPSQYRGAHGPLKVSDLRNSNAACGDWLQAAEDYGLPRNADFNGESTYGIGAYQLTLDGHWRTSTTTALLKPALARPNLDIELGAMATNLLHKGDRITGVAYAVNGEVKTVHADREVILCSGAVQTPQLLQLSGIGPSELLRRHSIKVMHDAPEVGENLQDHLQMRTIVELSDGRDSLNNQVRNPLYLAKMGLEWLFGRRGPLTVGAGQVGGAMRTRYAEGDRPDLQLFVMPLSVDKPGTPLHHYSGFTTSLWQCHPKSRGSIRICSADPFQDPEIRPNYLSHRHDCRVIVEGVKIVREIYGQPAFRKRWRREVVPGSEYQSDTDILDAVRRMAGTVYHLVGTCRMGSDQRAVVDPQLRVNGVSGLRVVDASVMPLITAANTNAPTIMIAEKAANLIRG